MSRTPFEAAARTVIDGHDHLVGLHGRAVALRDSLGVHEHGYFTPSEDEQTRHLLVSYWQVRSALLEVIEGFRYAVAPVQGWTEEDRDRAFLSAYAAAVVLVDAARFLRESVGADARITCKLNEGEPCFGIPEGVYDTIQRSLTSPTHAWHLHHATEHYRAHGARLAARARGDELLEPVHAIIEALEDRVRVSPADYARARLAVRAEQFKRAVTEHTFGRALYFLQEICSRMVSHVAVKPGHLPSLPTEVRDDLGGLLQPGDVLITRKEYAATNYFLPGYWPHAALYLGDRQALESLGLDHHHNVRPRWRKLLELDRDEPRRVLEALRDGVWIRSIGSPFGVDAITLIRPRLSASQRAEALGRGLFHEGKPYDFDFDFTRSDRLVCTEVIYRSYEGIGGVSFRLQRRAGRLTLSAEDLLRMALSGDGFEAVASFIPARRRLALAGDAERLIRETIGPG